MTRKEFDKYCKIIEQELKKTVETRLPKILGPLAKSHFQQGFREGGFINASLEKWKPVQRSGSGAAAQYGPLLSGRNNLYNSITYIPSRGRVTITNLAPYAAIHNSGGTLHPSVTDRMRRFAWHRISGLILQKNAEIINLIIKKFGRTKKNSLLCTLFYGTSCKVVKNDAFGDDMRTGHGGHKAPVKILTN